MIEGAVEVHAYTKADGMRRSSVRYFTYQAAIDYIERCSVPVEGWSQEETIWIIAPQDRSLIPGQDSERSYLIYWLSVDQNLFEIREGLS